MSLDAGIIIVTSFLAILGGVVSAHGPQKRWQKLLYGAAFVIAGSIAGVLLIYQSQKNTRAAETLSENIQKVQEANKEIARVQDLNTKLQSRLIDLSNESLASITGGNSFCYIHMLVSRDGVDPVVLSKGKYPIYDLTIRLWNPAD